LILAFLILLPLVCAAVNFLPMSKARRNQFFCAVTLLHAGITASFWVKLPAPEFNGFLTLDAVGLIVLSIVSLIFVSLAVFMLGYFEHERRSNRKLVSGVLLLLATMTLVAVSYHLGLLWVAVETTTLFSAPLISFHRNQQTLEATWKYLLVCSVGIALALLGTFFLAIAAQDVRTLLLPAILDGAPTLSVNWLKLGVIFLVVGYGCKMGLAPTHSWKPEAYGQSTGMVAVLMAGGLTQCAFLALLRVAQICFRTGLNDFYSSILLLAGVLSLVVPAVFILGEKNLKRAFAYSSIEHMGILALGLGLGGIGIVGALLHMINNALAKVVMFLTAGSVAQKYGSSRLGDVSGVIKIYPATGVFLLVALLAGTGMFPFATFHSELLILNAAVMSRHYLVAGVAMVCLAVMFIGIARIVFGFVYGQPTQPVLAQKENDLMNAAITVAAGLLLLFGVWLPAPVAQMIRSAALIVAG